MTRPTKDDAITYADLKAKLEAMTPDQLAQPVIWEGDERGGYVLHLWEADEDWIGDPGDGETYLRRSEAMQHYADDYTEAEVCIPKGALRLMVDWP